MKALKKQKTSTKKDKQGNLTVLVSVVILMAIILVGVYVSLQSLFAVETYYVLAVDVGSDTRIQPDMLVKRVVSKGGGPQNAISLEEVKRGNVYTKIPLRVGDVLSESNTGLSLATSAGVPDDWVITSFLINSNDAIGGNIRRGDYFDVMGVDENGARYLFVNLLALQVNPPGIAEEGGVMNSTIQYIIGLPQEQAIIFHQSLASFGSVKIIKSPYALKYEDRPIEGLDALFLYDKLVTPIYDTFGGTDSSFTPVLRDKFGRPVNKQNCMAGIIDPATLCENVDLLTEDRDPIATIPVVPNHPEETIPEPTAPPQTPATTTTPTTVPEDSMTDPSELVGE